MMSSHVNQLILEPKMPSYGQDEALGGLSNLLN